MHGAREGEKKYAGHKTLLNNWKLKLKLLFGLFRAISGLRFDFIALSFDSRFMKKR